MTSFDESMFSFDMEEAEDILEKARREVRQRDGRICICGHPMATHTEFHGVTTCKPSKMQCKCKQSRAVIEVSDTRVFRRKGRGNGAAHALSAGIVAAKQAELDLEYLIEARCDTCQTEGVPISPVNVTREFVATEEETGYSVFMCDKCRAL